MYQVLVKVISSYDNKCRKCETAIPKNQECFIGVVQYGFLSEHLSLHGDIICLECGNKELK